MKNELTKQNNSTSLKAIHEIGTNMPVGETLTLTKHKRGVTVKGSGTTTLVVGKNKTRIYRTVPTV